MDTYHVPVLADEVLEGLQVKRDGLYLDCTLGGGGHSEMILAHGARLLAFDKDDDAITFATARLQSNPAFNGRFTIVKTDFHAAKATLERAGVTALDGVLMDLGISSHQVDDADRGFAYRMDGPLDMRMDRTQALSAIDVVNGYEESELADILFRYGEEKYARRIARAIVATRKISPIVTTGQLAEIVKASVPYQKNGHPAKKTFQAIRIEVNGELDGLAEAVEDVVSFLKPGGRLCVITFHSLEDRIVKQTVKQLSADCICDKSLPVCVCNHRAILKEIGRYRATDAELAANTRATSATLRVAEKL